MSRIEIKLTNRFKLAVLKNPTRILQPVVPVCVAFMLAGSLRSAEFTIPTSKVKNLDHFV